MNVSMMWKRGTAIMRLNKSDREKYLRQIRELLEDKAGADDHNKGG